MIIVNFALGGFAHNHLAIGLALAGVAVIVLLMAEGLTAWQKQRRG